MLDRGRQDDHQEAISARFREYEETIKPILEQFKSAGITVYDINGEQEPEAINKEIRSVLDVGSK